MIVERFYLLTIAVITALLIVWVWRRWESHRLQQLRNQDAPNPLLGLVETGRPALLYFTTPDCAQCRLQQGPIVGNLALQAGISVHTVDAVEQEDLAKHFGIMTVPTTVFLDGKLRPVAINHGLASLPQLQQQLAGIAA